jgi:LysR family transcriptional regulator, glycine cleavage system transcriptional activator
MTHAAEELHVTHGAVSRQIKILETKLGVQLFERLTRRIVLTKAGTEFLQVVNRVLLDLAEEANRLGRRNETATLRINASVSFANKWLAPRLGKLKARHPDLNVHLDVTDTYVDLSKGDADVAIRYGNGRYPLVLTERILDETVTPVCSPAYAQQVGGLSTVADLSKCVLLHEDGMLANWQKWFALAKERNIRYTQGPTFSHGSIAIEAAIRGEGVALGRSVIVADDTKSGRLIAPFPQIRLNAERGHDLLYRIDAGEDFKVRILRNWLAEEVGFFLASQG